MADEPTGKWRQPSPASSHESSSSNDEEDEDGYGSVEVTPIPPKRRRTEEEDDPTYTPEKEDEHDEKMRGKVPVRAQALQPEQPPPIVPLARRAMTSMGDTMAKWTARVAKIHHWHLVRDHVPITYRDWRQVPEHLKTAVAPGARCAGRSSAATWPASGAGGAELAEPRRTLALPSLRRPRWVLARPRLLMGWADSGIVFGHGYASATAW
nr:unnamed protein product [Digitaria exilis]